MNNLQFLTFFINTIVAVLNHESLLRASIVSASNELRLGTDEAPLPIISVFIGEQLTAVLNNLEQVSEGKLSPQEKTDLKLNVIGKIPEILLDNTDQNRTSPFAFTGNKFEFRAVGSKTNCAKPMTVLNSIVARDTPTGKESVEENPQPLKALQLENQFQERVIESEDSYDYAETITEEEPLSLLQKEIEMIKRALERSQGKRKLAAEELGISERTLYRKIKQYDLNEGSED